MWTLGIFIVACAAFTGGAHASVTPATVQSGANYTVSVVTLFREVATCHLESNAEETVDFSPDGDVPLPTRFTQQPGSDMAKCMVTISDFSSRDSGQWKIYFKDSSGTVGSTQFYNITVEVDDEDDEGENSDLITTPSSEVEATTQAILSPEPIENIERTVEYLEKERFDTTIGENHTIAIEKFAFVIGEKCLVQEPSGKQYTLTDDLSIEGVEIVKGSDIECGINVKVTTENIGDWVLIAYATRTSVPIEKRLPFTIYVEDFVVASPSEVTVSEGNDLHLRLRDPTDLHETCKLIAPSSSEGTFYIEAKNNDVCEFVVQNIAASGTGDWEITYGTSVIYRAIINVTVSARSTVDHDTLSWVNRKPVNTTVGPNDAIYCIVTDPSGSIVFDGFGQCRIVLERAADRHAGTWTIRVGLAGRVLLEEHRFYVTIGESVAKPQVITQVTTNKPTVILSCSVNSTKEIRACKFRNPQGTILLAHEGVGESQYVFHGVGSSYEAGIHSHECGIKITDPATTDLGLWRCALETEDEAYYGFLAVLCPWSLSIPEIAATVVTEPTLTASQSTLTREAGEPVTMSCSVQAPIRYCYFRAGNGTVYTVTPEHPSSDYEYFGAGFDAGECGVRFNSLVPSDSGRWSCHVGLLANETEQSHNIQLLVQEPLTTSVEWDNRGHLVVEGIVYSGQPLDYCRFVRMDGFGFLSGHAPANYETDTNQLSYGVCRLVISHPTVLERHPWTVVAKVTGRDAELSAYSDHALHGLFPPVNTRSISIYIWIFTILLGVLILTTAYFFGPKKNRDNTFRRMSSFRQSFAKHMPTQKQIIDKKLQNV